MKKRAFSCLISVGMSVIFLFLNCILEIGQLTVYASEQSGGQILIDSEYVIPDDLGWCTYYVVVATNNTDRDISIKADFTAFDKSGKELMKVHDYSDAVKKNQQFILYGQFKNVDIKDAADFKYSFDYSETDNCTYTSVDVDATKIGECIQVSATNYSEHDIQGVGVRTVFLNGKKAVGFDVVNIADVGYTFHGGSTNSQVVGLNAGAYDNYILTYTSAGNGEAVDF